MTEAGKLHTVKTLAESEPGLTESGISWTIHKNREALKASGAIFYSGKKLFIDRDLFVEFLKGEST